MSKTKVLLGGMTPVQSLNGELKYWNITKALSDVFETLEYDVDTPKAISATEDFGKYDIAFIGITAPMSLGAFHRLTGVMAALHYFRKNDVPTVLFVDDWDTRKMYASIRTSARNPETSVKPAARRNLRNDAEYFWSHFDEMHEVMRWLAFDQWPTTAAAFFNWGDHSKFISTYPTLTSESFWPIDVASTMHVDPTTQVKSEVRNRVWVMAALTDQAEWLASLGTSWELDMYGSRGSKLKRVKEDELLRVYQRNWGVLCSPYVHCGSGWQRPRIVFAAKTDSVLYSDPREMSGMPANGAYTDITIKEVESMSWKELERLARAQKTTLLESTDDYETLCTKVKTKIESLIASKSSGWGAPVSKESS